jgi:para-aminobenzoate synthetase/4-amino-4-deoxychorismate lyase
MCDSAVLARYAFLDDHLDRIAASARMLGFPFEREAALELLLGLARLIPGSVVVHVELDSEGGLSQSTRNAPTWNALPLSPGAFRSVTLMVSPFRTDPDDPFLRHKTTMRGFYNREHRRAVHDGFFDALFLNRLDRVTEGAITNVFARFSDRWVTPPLEDGLLPGIWRSHYLSRTSAVENSLTLEELLAADEIIVGNSVRGGVSVGRLIADPVVF